MVVTTGAVVGGMGSGASNTVAVAADLGCEADNGAAKGVGRACTAEAPLALSAVLNPKNPATPAANATR
jgi:hypothetical protein